MFISVSTAENGRATQNVEKKGVNIFTHKQCSSKGQHRIQKPCNIDRNPKLYGLQLIEIMNELVTIFCSFYSKGSDLTCSTLKSFYHRQNGIYNRMGTQNCIAINQLLKELFKALVPASLCQTENTTSKRRRDQRTRIDIL